MAPPSAFSSDQLIDSQMSLDLQFLVPTDNTVSSDPTQTTYISNKYNDISLKLPSTEDNSDSLMKTEEFLEFVDELSQEPSPLSDREGTSNQDDTVPSVKAEESFHSTKVVNKTSENVDSSFESQDISIVKVPENNGVESIDNQLLKVNLVQLCHIVKKVSLLNWILRVQVNSCQHNLVIKKTQLYLMRVQILSLIWGFQKIALKIVLLVLLLAKFLQKIPMSSLILFLTNF